MINVPKYVCKLVKESSSQYNIKEQQIHSPEDIAILAEKLYKEADREEFITIMLDTKHNVIGTNSVSTGTLSATAVHPREVFKAAIIHNTSEIIILHNHPSGDPTPSSDDIKVTNQLKKAGEILQIPIIDSIIYGDKNKYYSMKEKNII